jgi:hypothetical protein
MDNMGTLPDGDCGHVQLPDRAGATVPTLERLCYFFGQMLEPADFRAEQSYFATLLALLARHGVGWGVACGLDVDVELDRTRCGDQEPDRDLLVLTVSPGIAIDCRGRLVVLRKEWRCRLRDVLDPAAQEALLAGRPVHVSVRHVETPTYPSRAVGEHCDPLASVYFGRIRDDVCVVLSADAPQQDECEPCLQLCPDPRVLLAGVRLPDPTDPTSVAVHPELRRLLARHELTTIAEAGWVHGGNYGRQAAEELLTGGVGLRFSRPVLAATLGPGVVDLVVYEGGGGRRDAWYFKDVEVAIAADGEVVDEIRVRLRQPEGFQDGDRILLRVRCDFVLDRCCRAVSGAHLGGAVPFDPVLAGTAVEHPEPASLTCPHPPDRAGPWRSGNGVEGGVWETWIHVRGYRNGDRTDRNGPGQGDAAAEAAAR